MLTPMPPAKPGSSTPSCPGLDASAASSKMRRAAIMYRPSGDDGAVAAVSPLAPPTVPHSPKSVYVLPEAVSPKQKHVLVPPWNRLCTRLCTDRR